MSALGIFIGSAILIGCAMLGIGLFYLLARAVAAGLRSMRGDARADEAPGPRGFDVITRK